MIWDTLKRKFKAKKKENYFKVCNKGVPKAVKRSIKSEKQK